MVKRILWYVFAAIIVGILLSSLPRVLSYTAANTRLELTIFLGLFGVIVMFFYVGAEGLLKKRQDMQEVVRGTTKMWSQRVSKFRKGSTPGKESTIISSSEARLRLLEPVPKAPEHIKELLLKMNEKKLARALKTRAGNTNVELERQRAEMTSEKRVTTSCSSCGTVVLNNLEFCPNCGARISTNTPHARTFKRN